jgi:aerobic-type carbon monoxide dehydrogenase small subunit (CoxS/CutS family)
MPKVALRINGAVQNVDVGPAETLLSVLRDTLGLTGTKYGCGEGQCGACTVLVDGQPVKSCQARASVLQGKSIRTIESLEENGRLHPLQEAFLKHEAMQCGYCTPGMIMAGVGLLASNPHPTDEAIIKAMDRNVCRCGTYRRILAAIKDAAGVAGARPRG